MALSALMSPLGRRNKKNGKEKLAPGMHVWEFGRGKHRHILKFYHSTLTGKRIMWLDEREVYRVNTKYRLSGAVKFKLSKAVCVLNIDSHNAGSLSYTLVVNGKTVKENSCNDAIMRLAAWEVKLPHGLYDVEFDTESFLVYINKKVTKSEGDFVDTGSAYKFTMPDGEAARVLVIPTKYTDRPIVKLYIDDVLIGDEEDSDDEEAVVIGADYVPPSVASSQSPRKKKK